jgi:hypothetical protein
MVICLRLEIDAAFESDLETLKYIVYQGMFFSLLISFIYYHQLFSAPFHESTESVPSNTNTKDLAVLKTASTGQREARELFVETYVFDGK